jgi:glucokinase
VPFACEGGHSSFAASNELEVELREWLSAKFGHVSAERVLSGPGMVDVYAFLTATGRETEPDGFQSLLAREGAQAITRTALEGTNARAVRALEMFCDAYGAEAGNLALKIMATGGVWIGGGIGPRIERFLKRRFHQAFVHKGRMQPLLERIPVRLIRNDKTALLGAARYALNLGRLPT